MKVFSFLPLFAVLGFGILYLVTGSTVARDMTAFFYILQGVWLALLEIHYILFPKLYPNKKTDIRISIIFVISWPFAYLAALLGKIMRL